MITEVLHDEQTDRQTSYFFILHIILLNKTTLTPLFSMQISAYENLNHVSVCIYYKERDRDIHGKHFNNHKKNIKSNGHTDGRTLVVKK